MKIKVCIGSSCHLKGSYDVIQAFQKLLSENDMSEKVELEGAFCLGKCGNGVSVQLDDRYFNLSVDQCKDFFEKEVLANAQCM